jgi:hypothetical protein
MKLSFLFLLAIPTMVGMIGCQTPSLDELHATGEDAYVPPEERGMDHVDINGQWRIESDVLDVVRDEATKRQVLMASAQNGVVLHSLLPPKQTRVDTRCTADAIYFDAYQNRFELIGNPVIEQGIEVTSKTGSDAKIVMYGDGGIVKDPPVAAASVSTSS